jgi:hypothetical protein
MSKKVLKLAGRRPMLLALIVMATVAFGLVFTGWLTPTPGKAQTGADNPQPNDEATDCVTSSTTTNCSEGTVTLSSVTVSPAIGCIGSAFSASVSPTITAGQVIVDTSYTNANPNATNTTCDDTYTTNTPTPGPSYTWTVSGPGSFSAGGSGLSASFTPTNCGSGTVTFIATWQDACDTNYSSTSVSGSFQVVDIEHQCVATTPTNQNRTTIGIGEQVNLTACGAPGTVTWSTSAGTVSPTNGSSTTLTAPGNAATATVTVNYSGGSCTLDFSVIEPSGFLASNAPVNGIGVNISGAGMINDLWLTPLSVSFYQVETFEVPATSNLNVTGYFANTSIFPSGPPIHDTAHGAGSWIGTGQNNYAGNDAASWYPASQPWSNGTLTWPIPNAWRVVSSSITNSLGRYDQNFSIESDGTFTIQKYGHTVTRNTNNVYTTVN